MARPPLSPGFITSATCVLTVVQNVDAHHSCVGVVNDTGVISGCRLSSFYLIGERFRRVWWIQEEVGTKVHIQYFCICH